MKACFSLLAVFILALPLAAQNTAINPVKVPDEEMAREAQIRFENRLNELMLWKLSDELALKPLEEQKLKTILKKYQEQRKSGLLQQEEALTKMADTLKENAEKTCDVCLTGFDRSVTTIADANAKEFKELRTLLGPFKMQKFLVIRSQMTRDVRDALRQPATPPPATK